jgi:hypothetical protein
VLATEGSAPGQIHAPAALAADSAPGARPPQRAFGAPRLYVAEGYDGNKRIQQRDAHGNWSVIAPYGSAPGEVLSPTALATDTGGNFYVAESGLYADEHRIQKRDAQGNWSLIATWGYELGQVDAPTALATDMAGSLYVADNVHGIQQRDAQGKWSVIAPRGTALGQVGYVPALGVDRAGNLFVADPWNNRVMKYTPKP